MTETRLDELKRFIQTQGWSWRAGKPIPYGEQIIIRDGLVSVTLDFYPKRGKMVIGGADSTLKAELQEWVAADTEAPAASEMIGGPHIGLDESGKGDWFGPLVVAAVYVDERSATALRRAGVRDSKELASPSLARIGDAIEQLVPSGRRAVRVLLPDEYNHLYQRHNNINLLLAEIYAQVAGELQRSSGATVIVCDQFSQRADRLERAFAAQGLPRPQQQHHAERASIAVAAASILAAAAFNAALAALGHEAGLGRALPAGASDLRLLEASARAIIAQHGAAAMARYAKLNFKPVQALLISTASRPS